jgi:O-glycosyl hydrolase
MRGRIADMTAVQVNKAFGTGAGQIGLSIPRIRVLYDEIAFNPNVPTALLLKSLGATIIVSPWISPATMKSNNNIVANIGNGK